MLRLTLTIFTMIAMAHVQVDAKSRTSCTVWESGNYKVEIDGVTQNCKGKRTCTTVETDPDGQCRQVFGCSTTIEIQYGDCTKAAVRNPATGAFQGGGSRSVFDPGVAGKPKSPFGAPATGGVAP